MTQPPGPVPPVVTVDALPGLSPAPVLVDARWYLDGRSGRAAHEAGHLPGAVWLDLEHWLSGPVGPDTGRHPLPSPERFTEGLGQAGIGDDDLVVAYDDQSGRVASRLVWLLRATGRRARLLDGGTHAWPGPWEQGPVARTPTSPQVRPWPAHLLVDLAGAVDRAEGAGVLLDSREPSRYRGEVEPVDPRPGHVPGAVNLPTSSALGEDRRLLPPEQLRAVFDAVGAGADADVVASCGSGVTACFTLLAREHAGLPPARLWPGSYSAWTSDPDRPVTLGDRPD